MGNHNSAVGHNALSSNSTGSFNSAFGQYALSSNLYSFNSAFGYAALRENTTGQSNSAFGAGALLLNETGYANSAVGDGAMSSNDSGNYNTAVGRNALLSNTTGNYNSVVGKDALFSSTSGDGNVAIGFLAGYFQTSGSDNIYLANVGTGAESGQIRIGTISVHTQAWMAGIYNNALGSSDTVCVTSAGRLGLCASSAHLKESVEDMGGASELLAKLRPVTFRFKKEHGDGNDELQYGLIAEEVAEVAPELVVTDANGNPYSVRYNELAPMLLNEAQKQQRTIEKQERVIADLSARLALLEEKPGAGVEESTR
jgi:hypothetical protein